MHTRMRVGARTQNHIPGLESELRPRSPMDTLFSWKPKLKVKSKPGAGKSRHQKSNPCVLVDSDTLPGTHLGQSLSTR